MQSPGIGVAVAAAAIFAAPLLPALADAVEVEVDAVEGLRFEPVRFEAEPGAALRIRVANRDVTDLPHNFVIGKPGSLKKLVADALAMGEAGAGRGFVPDVPEILAATKLLAGGQSETVEFSVPEEPGIYPYVCTFPGHGYVMYGALYVGVGMPESGDDPNIPPVRPAASGEGVVARPSVRRIFMPKAGPAAIAVALPNGQNFCWDAGACRLRYAWKGDFIDAEKHFGGTGSALAKVLGKVYWRCADGRFPFRFDGAAGAADGGSPARFLGYRLVSGRPTFLYEADGVKISESIEELADGSGLLQRIEIVGAQGDVGVFLGSEKGGQHCDGGVSSGDGWITLSRGDAQSFTLTVSGSGG